MKSEMKQSSVQKKYFEKPFEKNFKWRTENFYIKKKEVDLLRFIAKNIDRLPPNAKVLEIGCGEGPNLALLATMCVTQKIHGIDLSFERVAFCQRRIANMLGATASAVNLPFNQETFDFVFFRDLLHHMGSDQEAVLAESLRVLKKGGTLCFLEANGRNPCFCMLALAVRAERGLLKSNRKSIKSLALKYGRATIFMHEPSNLFRVIYHYSAGVPALVHIPIFPFLTDMISRIAKMFSIKNTWAYICVEIKK